MAIMVEPYLSFILSGKKTIESRLTQKRVVPFGRVSIGDVVILKKSGGAVSAIFEVSNVYSFEPKTEDDVYLIKNKYNQRLCGSDDFWESKKGSRFATLIEIGKLMILTPITYSFKNRQAWIAMNVQQPPPTILCISGEIASGKTYISQRLACMYGCMHFSISDYLRQIIFKTGVDVVNSGTLQETERSQISLGWSVFCKLFLDFTKWNYTGYLVIDGIRCIEFPNTLKTMVEPRCKVVLIYVEDSINEILVNLFNGSVS